MDIKDENCAPHPIDNMARKIETLSSFLEKRTGVAPARVTVVPRLARMAEYDPEADEIKIRKEIGSDLDLAFAVCHEWRHCWQLKSGNMDSARYMDRDHSADADEYNLQPEEKDANAFGWAMVEIMTDGKVRPTLSLA